MSLDTEDNYYNIPEVVTNDIRDVRRTITTLEMKLNDMDNRYTGLQAENEALRQQLLKLTQLIATYPTRRDVDRLEASIRTVQESMWHPSGSFINELKQTLTSAEPGILGPPHRTEADIATIHPLVVEQVALEMSKVNNDIHKIYDELEQRATKRSVVATIKQRFDELTDAIDLLKCSISKVLREKADVNSVNDLLKQKADANLVVEALGGYVKHHDYDGFVSDVRKALSILSSSVETGDGLTSPSGGAENSELRLTGIHVPVLGGLSNASTRLKLRKYDDMFEAFASFRESVSDKLSKLSLQVVAQSQAVDMKTKQLVTLQIEGVLQRLEDLAVAVKANTVSISKFAANSETAITIANSLKDAEIGDVSGALAPICREVSRITARLNSLESSLGRKADSSDFTSFRDRLDSKFFSANYSLNFSDRPTLGQVRQMIADSLSSVHEPHHVVRD